MEETIMKDAGFWAPLLVIGIFTLIGIVFLSVGIGLRVNENKKKENCTQPVVATVKNMVKDRSYKDIDDIITYYWYPVYEYKVGDAIYTRISNIGNVKKQYEIGQKVNILVNPNNPEEIYNDNEKQELIGKIFLVVGIALLLIGLLVAYVINVAKRGTI